MKKEAVMLKLKLAWQHLYGVELHIDIRFRIKGREKLDEAILKIYSVVFLYMFSLNIWNIL